MWRWFYILARWCTAILSPPLPRLPRHFLLTLDRAHDLRRLGAAPLSKMPELTPRHVFLQGYVKDSLPSQNQSWYSAAGIGGNGLFARSAVSQRADVQNTYEGEGTSRVILSICRLHFTTLHAIQVHRFYKMLQGIVNNPKHYTQLLAHRLATEGAPRLFMLSHHSDCKTRQTCLWLEFVLQLVSISKRFFTPNCIIAFLDLEAVKQRCALLWQCDANLNQRRPTCSRVIRLSTAVRGVIYCNLTRYSTEVS
jgi:hypothetical protein